MSRWTKLTVLTLCSTLAWSCADSPLAPNSPELAKGGGGGGPSVDAAIPDSASVDTTLNIRVVGSGFVKGSVVKFLFNGEATPKLVTGPSTFVDKNTLIVTLIIAVDAELGAYDVEVTTPRGKKGIGSELFAVTEKHGKPGGGEEDPPPPDGIIHMSVGWRLDGVINSIDLVGAVAAGFLGVRPVGSVVQVYTGMSVGYFSEPGVVTNADACFPFTDGNVRGTLSFTETEDGFGRATFSFSGLAQDGVTNTGYVLTLDGAVPWDNSGWPVPAPVGAEAASRSAFMVATWTLTNSGPKGGKKRGCSGSSSFPTDRPVRIELRHITPAAVVNPGTAPFLSSPFDLAVPHTMTLRFDHTDFSDGVCVDFRGLDCSGFNGGLGYEWSVPEGTQIYAAADGRVAWASVGGRIYCPALEKYVWNTSTLSITHDTDAADGKTQTFATSYKNLSSIAGLSLGDTVLAGQPIAVFDTGECNPGRSFHFAVRAAAGDQSLDWVDRFRTRVDPYGWLGDGRDPALDVDFYRTLNQLLWIPGQAPAID
ncbi:MAG: peptidoglycan DD-metalloendopeptidase family protein [Gemmatimonadetes bacterium]|nr:peptidoglycan DD-metalloendopeptidase family protein [Gemmatimonadota bacterium]